MSDKRSISTPDYTVDRVPSLTDLIRDLFPNCLKWLAVNYNSTKEMLEINAMPLGQDPKPDIGPELSRAIADWLSSAMNIGMHILGLKGFMTVTPDDHQARYVTRQSILSLRRALAVHFTATRDLSMPGPIEVTIGVGSNPSARKVFFISNVFGEKIDDGAIAKTIEYWAAKEMPWFAGSSHMGTLFKVTLGDDDFATTITH